MVDRIDFILKKCQIALLQHTNSADISSLTIALIFIVLLVLIALAAVTIRQGSQSRYLVFIATTIFLFLFYRLKMSRAATANTVLVSYSSIDPNSRQDYATALCKYLISGFELKVARTKVVILFYTILTPVFLISAYDFFYGFMTERQLFFSVLVCLPLNWMLWRWWFSEDMAMYSNLKIDYQNLLRELL